MNNNDDKPKCRSCGALILWAVTAKGRRIPLDAEAVDDGNMRLETRGPYAPPLAVVLSGAVSVLTLKETPLYKSHFATCPNAQHHRRSK